MIITIEENNPEILNAQLYKNPLLKLKNKKAENKLFNAIKDSIDQELIPEYCLEESLRVILGDNELLTQRLSTKLSDYEILRIQYKGIIYEFLIKINVWYGLMEISYLSDMDKARYKL